ncbi:hypothetical protein NOF55_17265 [Rhizobiaceae bacterium BDR2-2]|uniref:Uncharacterized protein n=1 Tax=Ectorhizobium quercum TaxID=2965071 RepID=A0AAE3N161_9HYPH|nr:hypothetical protein [Ectorhizobium quercum]MCX8998863.1 hypothetical protein [Ectorhizobium quercum]
MDTTNQEQVFSAKIDCKFPYLDVSKAAALIAEARSISTNAEFCVLYEIIAPPASERLPKQTQRELLAAWVENATSSLAARIADLANEVIDGGEVPTEKALDKMHEVAATEGQYAALAVVSHLAYALSDSVDCEMIDTLEEQIRMQWDAPG